MSADALERIMNGRIAEIWTALPARVDSYDAPSQTVTCTPTVRAALATEEDDPRPVAFETLPQIHGVPVVFPRGGNCSISFPIAPGDHVLLIVPTWDPSGWRVDGIVSDPGLVLSHYIGGAFAVPGIAPMGSALPVGQAGANALVLDAPEIRLTKEAIENDDKIAIGKKVEDALNELKDAIANAGSGDAIPAAVAAVGPFNVRSAKVKAK